MPIFMVPYFVVKKQWRVVCAFMVATAVYSLLTPALSWQYATRVAPTLNIYGVSADNYYDQSLSSALARLAGASSLWEWVALAWAGWWYGWWLFWSWRERKLTVIPPLMLLVIGLMARAPIWPHYMVYLYPVAILSFDRQWWWLGISWLLLQLHFDNANVVSQRIPAWLISTGTYWYLGLLLLVSYRYLRSQNSTQFAGSSR